MHPHLLFLILCTIYPFIYAFEQSGYEINDLSQTSKDPFSAEANSWSSTTNYPNSFITTCDGTPLLSGEGIPDSAGPFRRKYKNLPKHKSIIISYEVWLIDPSSTISGSFSYGTGSTPTVNTITAFSSATSDQAFLTTSKCGTSSNDLIGMTIIQSFQHNDDVLYIEIQHSGGQVGFRNIRILIAKDDLHGEGNCAISDPTNAISSSSRCDCSAGKYLSSSSTCKKCDSACLNCFGDDAKSCLSCSDGYYYNGASCLPCHSSCKTCSGPKINQCLACPSGTDPNKNSQCTATAVQIIIDIRTSVQTVIGAGLVASSVFGLGNSGAVRASISSKMIQYIKYLDISYPEGLEATLTSSNNDFLNFGIDNYSSGFGKMPSGFKDDGSAYDPAPEALTKYGKIEPNFLINVWNQIKILFTVTGNLVLVLILDRIIQKKRPNSRFAKYIQKLKINLLGLLLNYVYNDTADVFFFAAIDYRATKEITFLSVFNIIFSIFLMIGALAFLTTHFLLIVVYQAIKKSNKDVKKLLDDFETKHQGIQVLWRDFKDKSFFHMGFLFFVIIRDILFSFLLTLLFEYPLLQSIIIMIMSAIMLCYLCILRPIDDKNELVQTISCEGILFAINICLLILAGLDRSVVHSQTVKDNIEIALLVFILLFNFIPLLTLAAKLLTALKKARTFYKLYKLKKRQLQTKINQIIPFEPIKDETKSVVSPSTPREHISDFMKPPLISSVERRLSSPQSGKRLKVDEENDLGKLNKDTSVFLGELISEELKNYDAEKSPNVYK